MRSVAHPAGRGRTHMPRSGSSAHAAVCADQSASARRHLGGKVPPGALRIGGVEPGSWSTAPRCHSRGPSRPHYRGRGAVYCRLRAENGAITHIEDIFTP